MFSFLGFMLVESALSDVSVQGTEAVQIKIRRVLYVTYVEIRM